MIVVSKSGQLTFHNKIYHCALGRSGVIAAAEKRESDGATPAGIYPLRALYYRADKFAPSPETKLPAIAIQLDDGWCDDPMDVNYNKPIKLPHKARHEKMWRDDDLYDLVVVIGHNDDPVISGKGSCIFMHIAKPGYEPTEGCVALNRDDFLEILKGCDADTKIEILHSV